MSARSLVAAAAAACALALPAAATAAPQVATCRVDGATGSSAGPIYTMRGALSGTGGSGYFTWSATAACVVTLPSGAVISTGAYLNSTDGIFENLVCGSMVSTGTLAITFNDPRASSLSPRYSARITAHEGPMTLIANGATTGAGEVTWLPQDVQCLSDVSQFTMRGTFTITA
jgi:hypothetical protein